MAIMSLAAFAQDEQTVRIYAHRGGKAEADENTLAAFNAAYKAGYRGFETDIRMTADGDLVLLHDSDLAVATNGKGNVETTKTKTVKGLKVGKNKVLFLDDLLEWISKKGDIQYFEFELKMEPSLYPDDLMRQISESVYHKVMAVKPLGATFVITSFDTRPLTYLREKFSADNLVLISNEPVNTSTITHVLDLGLKRLNAKIEGTCRSAMEKAHKEGITVNLWPTDDVQDVALGISLGADAICTDAPAAVKKGLNKAMPWVTIVY